MHNRGIAACGKLADKLRIDTGTTSARLSPATAQLRYTSSMQRVQVRLTPWLYPQLYAHFPPAINPLSPLIEHYLYPVSTAPIIRTKKENLKKG